VKHVCCNELSNDLLMKLLEINSAIVYHGTARPGAKFSTEHSRVGIYFSTRYADAKDYAENDVEFYDDNAEPKVIHAKLHLKNPKDLKGSIESQELTKAQVKEWEDQGYDGLHSGTEWVAFYPSQIEIIKVENLK